MPEIEFHGDWNPEEAREIANLLKSLDMGDAVPEDLNPPQITDFPTLLSKRQKKLIEMLRTAGKKALQECEEGAPCDEDRQSWDAYGSPLGKAVNIGQIKTTTKGRFRLNNNRRWERIDGDSATPTQLGSFEFPVTVGEFGEGVYFPVLSAPIGGVRLRLRFSITPTELISDEQFYDFEHDLSQDTDLILDSKGVKAIAQTEGDTVTLLCIRNPSDITPLGIIANSGPVPTGTPRFNLIEVQNQNEGLTAEVEMVGEEEPLTKSATTSRHSTLQSTSYLHGTKLVRSSAPPLDRTLVRKAIERCKLDGIDFSGIEVTLVQGKPDFLPGMVHAFCLPSDNKVCLCPHDPQAAIGSFCAELANRLQSSVRAGAIAGDAALDVLARAAQLTPQWWLETLIKRYAGAILCARYADVMQESSALAWQGYLNLLVGRGAQYWGNRRAIAECMAEDFRVAHDPAGLPNLVTLEWDAAVPAIARASQQLLLRSLQGDGATRQTNT